MFLYLELHLFGHVALLGSEHCFLQMTHAFVLEIELPLESGDLLLDLRVLLLVDLAGLHKFLHFFVEDLHLRSQFLILHLQVAGDLLVLLGL